MGWELQALEAASTNDLLFLLDAKLSALSALAETIDDQRVPLLTEDVLIDRGVLQSSDEPWHHLEHKYGKLRAILRTQSVPMNEPWDADVLGIVRNYLATRNPRAQLDEIRAAMEKIRSALTATFSISDILLHAGDPRAGRRRQRY